MSFPVAAYTRFAVDQYVESAVQAFVVAELGAASTAIKPAIYPEPT